MKLIIHGGFFSESTTDAETKRLKQGAISEILKNAYEFLKDHTARETVVYTVELLENNPLFNAGIGSQIQSDGIIRMSASIMDGSTYKFSGVINLEEVKNPIRVAENLIKAEDRVLGGECATKYARSKGFEKFSTEIPQRRKEFEAKLASKSIGTVGCVALDKNGNLAAATSTGGKGFEVPGRVSDSATVAGNFCNENCGVSCTGVGEDIVSVALAAKIVTRYTDGQNLETAFYKTFNELKKIDGFAGAISINNKGEFYHQDSHPTMVFGHYDGNELKIFN
jgi:L-asparaginase